MQIENEFVVDAPVEDLWLLLLDVERTARCMPGGELTEVIDDRTWRGKVNVRLGMMSLGFEGTVTMTDRDDVAHRIRLQAQGIERKGKGAASATVTSWLVPDGSSTTVSMLAQVQLTGPVSQISRGLLPEISRRLTEQFARCLQASYIEAQPSDTPRGEAAERQTISGLRLGLSAAFAMLRRFLARLIRGKAPNQ